MDFAEKQICHAIIRGLCNRAEGGREGSVSAATGNVATEKRGPLVSWTYCEEDANEPQELAACLLGTTASQGTLGMGRGEAGQVVAAMQSSTLSGDPAARRSSAMGCGLGWLCPLTSPCEVQY